MRAIREYHGLQGGVCEVEEEAETEGAEEQETTLAQQIRHALGQAHDAQREGNLSLAAQHHKTASRLRDEMEQQGRGRSGEQQARSDAESAMNTSNARAAKETESGAGASERVAQERREQQVGASEYGEETTRESEEESAREQQPWGTEETQEGGGTDTYETGREEDGWHARGSKDCARRGRTSE